MISFVCQKNFALRLKEEISRFYKSALLRGLCIALVSWASPDAYMDEEFHIGQTWKFVTGNFSEWDPSLTTFPGIFIFSAALVKIFSLPFKPWILRMLNGVFFGALADRACADLEISSLEVAVLPTHFFYHLLFYTDPAATALVLSSLGAQRKGNLEISGIFGIFAVAVRQTNIVWVFIIAAGALWDNRRNFQVLWRLRYHILTGMCFASFFVWNDFSVVLGHKGHHSFSAHFAQINYFLCTWFVLDGPKFWLQTLRNFQVDKRIWRWLTCFSVTAACAFFGTVVHPFLLADNRHFSFFVWRKFLSFPIFRNFFVPAVASTAAVYGGFAGARGFSRDLEISKILFWFAVLAVLVPSPLLEFRYFNIPLILLSARPGNFFWNFSLSLTLVAVFCIFPFYSAQSGKLERFIL